MIQATIAIDRSQEQRRREPREPVNADIPLRQLGETAVDARLVNISSRGFMAETRAEIGAGSRIWLTLPGPGRVNALIVWARGGRIGGEFSAPIDPLSVFQALGQAHS